MKLLRHGPKGQEKPGFLDDMGRIRDLSDHISDLNCAALESNQIERLARINLEELPVVGGSPRLGVPIADIGNVICIGLNYRDHAEESGMPIPEEPIVFSKSTSAITGPCDTVTIPRDSEKTDWEVELCVVIGKRASYVEEENALEHVAGYTIINDISERAFQIEHGGQWIKGKSAESFAPIGPWLVTPDEIADPQNLNLWLDLNGERRQTGNSKSMIYGVTFLISYLSRFMTLLPGDVIATGTPPGVGMGQKPPVYLKAGDVMKLGVEGLGEQTQTVEAYKS
jgi:2-keto-4-pentenoate hydratase/2-oxohepta-3-ene-1,7-dioic acid hydratase in catechol pathway